MPDEDLPSPTPSQLREKALARWENEGGATRSGQAGNTASGEPRSDASALTNGEGSQLQIVHGSLRAAGPSG